MDFAESMISVHHVDKGGMDLGQRGGTPDNNFCVLFVGGNEPTGVHWSSPELGSAV